MADEVKKAARVVQRETGMTYTMSLRLVTGKLVVAPRAADCIVVAALAKVGLPTQIVSTGRVPCACPRCQPGDD